MCGIAGIAFHDPARQPEKQMLERMASIMRHRGPDSEGFHLSPGVGLGVRRLSIIDTVTGDQPIANEDGSVVVICNGEIYNYVELRQRLQANGHRFRTHSDVEVIAHLYEEDPHGFLDDLRGMFALAIWDAKNRQLLLARDRLGIKPLHYMMTSQGLVFGSELKAVLAAGLVIPERDCTALRDLFTFGFVRAPRTMVAGVNRLMPGHYLLFCAGKIEIKLYWDVSFPNSRDYDRRVSGEEWAEALREKLTESVHLHLRSDVPVGAWLSGGIDSSSVTALMSRELQQPVHSFTLGFENRETDELAGNRLLDEFPEYRLVSHRTEFQPQHFELLSRAVWHGEQPLSAGTPISSILISELAARQVKVVLTGEGSDEILGGYTWYRTHKILGLFDSFPQFLRSACGQILWKIGKRPGAGQIMMAPSGMNRERFCALIGSPSVLDSKYLLLINEAVQAQWAAESDNPLIRLPAAFDSWHPFAQLQYLDIKLRLAELIVSRLDLFSMANSLEARVPYLDHPLVEFCATIPPWFKMRGWREKDILRRAMRNLLPQEICQRKKFPLSAPLRDLVQAVLPRFAATLLSSRELQDRGWFNPTAVGALMAEHQAGNSDHSRLLLLVLTTQLWDELFLKRFREIQPTELTGVIE